MAASARDLADGLLTAAARAATLKDQANDSMRAWHETEAELKSITDRIGKQLAPGLYIFKGHIINVCADGTVHVDKATDLETHSLEG